MVEIFHTMFLWRFECINGDVIDPRPHFYVISSEKNGKCPETPKVEGRMTKAEWWHSPTRETPGFQQVPLLCWVKRPKAKWKGQRPAAKDEGRMAKAEGRMEKAEWRHSPTQETPCFQQLALVCRVGRPKAEC